MAASKVIIPWNKGLTAKDDPRILVGKEHPMYGKHPKLKTREKMRK